MKKISHRLQIILFAAAALFIAVSPLIHGLHLVLASHSHHYCSICTDNTSAHRHGEFHNCHSHAVSICFTSAEDSSGGHNPDSCPLCRQFTQLLKNQVILQSYVPVTLQESFPEERIELPWIFFSISFDNIIPRAPPAC